MLMVATKPSLPTFEPKEGSAAKKARSKDYNVTKHCYCRSYIGWKANSAYCPFIRRIMNDQ
jgi:hypothetical protein